MITTQSAVFSTSPYPGLRPFRDDEADIFFGREEQTDQLVAKLQSNRFIAVVGPSGCGKSSLVRAGMISALGAGLFNEAGGRWRVVDMRPGEEPIARLANALVASSVLNIGPDSKSNDLAFVQAMLRRGPLGLVEVLSETKLTVRPNVLLLVDQFEEIFRFRRDGDPDEADSFVSLLLASASQRELPVYVVITMRSDFLGDSALFRGLPEAMNDSQFLTPRLTREQIEAAIVRPARVFDGRIDTALVNRLLNEIGTGLDQLPVLQHLLMRMWTAMEQRQETAAVPSGNQGSITTPASIDQRTVTFDDLVSVGGLKNALSQHADEAYGNLSEPKKRIAELMFKRLTERTTGHRDTRRPTRLVEIAEVAEADLEDVKDVVEEFRKPERSFVMPPTNVLLKPETILDIGHESLIGHWSRLSKWADEEHSSVMNLQRARQTAILWKNHDADLWSGIDLERAVQWEKKCSPSPKWASRYCSPAEFAITMEFLRQSEQHTEQVRIHSKEDEERRVRENLERIRLEEKAKGAKLLRYLVGILTLAVILLAGAVWRSITQQRIAARALAESAEKQKELTEKTNDFLEEQKLGKKYKDIIADEWGVKKTGNAEEDQVALQQSLKADSQRQQIDSSPEKRDQRSQITVRYFIKDADKDKVASALQNLGFNVLNSAAVGTTITNAIWFGSDVSTEDVKLVSYTLIRAGIQIRYIGQFDNDNGRKSSIQVGGRPRSVGDEVWSVDRISSAQRTDFSK